MIESKLTVMNGDPKTTPDILHREEWNRERDDETDREDGEADADLRHRELLHRRGNSVEALYVVSVVCVVSVVVVVVHAGIFRVLLLKGNQT